MNRITCVFAILPHTLQLCWSDGFVNMVEFASFLSMAFTGMKFECTEPKRQRKNCPKQ